MSLRAREPPVDRSVAAAFPRREPLAPDALGACPARIVTTKVVLRPEGNATARTGAGAPSWDFLFHQSGMIGSATLFGNASCKHAMEIFPKNSCQGEFAVSFVGKLDPEQAAGASDDALSREGLDEAGQAAQLAAQRAVKGIAKLKVDRAEFDEQAAELLNTNVVLLFGCITNRTVNGTNAY